MKDETQVKDEIILVVKEAIRDNTTLAAVDGELAELNSNDVDHIAEAVADRLYADGYGDVAEWKRRAEVAERNDKIKERALDKATELAYEYRTEADTLSCSSCPMFHIFDSCKERGLYKDCSRRWKEEILRQAEREIEEEERK